MGGGYMAGASIGLYDIQNLTRAAILGSGWGVP